MLKINRLLNVKSHNVITIPRLRKISKVCEAFTSGVVYRAAFLLGFFDFQIWHLMQLQVLIPLDILLGRTFSTKEHVNVIIKWSKTVQTRNRVQCVTLPKLRNRRICPHRAKSGFQVMSTNSSLLQLPTGQGLNPLTDSRVRKILKRINVALDLSSYYFTFHDLRRSGATLAYNYHVPIQDIKGHGTRSKDYVYRYIQSDHSSGETLSKLCQ